MPNIEHQIKKARPTLRQVSPLSHWVVLIMGVFNIVLGLTLLFNIDKNRLSASLIIVNNILTYEFWGIVFISIGLIKLYALISNNWNLSRKTLILGVSVKAMWSVALIFRIFISPGTLFITSTWLCIAALQMACYIFFMPPNTSNYNQRRIDRK
jgi:hypothetical protein